MKKYLAASIFCNVFLIGLLAWTWEQSKRDLLALVEASYNGDRIHMGLHEKSLAAMESDDPEAVQEIARALRMLLKNSKDNEELLAAMRATVREALD